MKASDTPKHVQNAISMDNVYIDDNVERRALFYNVIIMVIIAYISYSFDINRFKLAYDILFGFLLTYVVDIMFVQQTFVSVSKNIRVFKKISYDDLSYRFQYMFNHNIFYKYMVVVFIGYILDTSIFNYIDKQILQKYNLLQNTRYKSQVEYLIHIFIRSFTSLLLLNFIKFKWAYIDMNDLYLTAIILSLFSVMLLVIVRTPTN